MRTSIKYINLQWTIGQGKLGYSTAMESFENMKQAFEIAEGETEWSSLTVESTALSPVWEHSTVLGDLNFLNKFQNCHRFES